MTHLRVLYIDDNIDMNISKFLDINFNNHADGFIYQEHEFVQGSSYDELIRSQVVQISDVIVIDSKLFTNASLGGEKITGEELSVILRQIYSFKEIIVMSQNPDDKLGIIQKYHNGINLSAQEYYTNFLGSAIKSASKSILIARRISKKLSKNKEVDEVLAQKISDSLDSKFQFDELTKSDIDAVIKIFQEIQEKFYE